MSGEIIPLRPNPPVLTLYTPDEYRRPLGVVAVQIYAMNYSAAVDKIEECLIKIAKEKFADVKLICNLQIAIQNPGSSMQTYHAIADAYGEVEE